MSDDHSEGLPIRAGDIDGLGGVYSEIGGAVLRSGETLLAQRTGCDVAVYGSWRRFFPKHIFHSLPGTPSGAVHLTSQRVVFVREIDVWKEVKPLLTPLGFPAAAEKESRLKRLRAKGARQFCEVILSQLRLVQVMRKPWLLRLRFVAEDDAKYEVFVHLDKEDPDFFDLLERVARERANKISQSR
jgi:hypothetical protein